MLPALVLTVFSWSASAQQPVASEYDVKAAIVFKIAKFVSWPEQAFTDNSEPLAVCVHKDDPLAEALRSLNGKPIKGRVFSVRYLNGQKFEPNYCQILLIADNYSDSEIEIIDSISDQPVLTIVDHDRPVSRPGIIGLQIKKNHVQFDIDVGASESAGLDISAQLLQLAVITNGQGENR